MAISEPTEADRDEIVQVVTAPPSCSTLRLASASVAHTIQRGYASH